MSKSKKLDLERTDGLADGPMPGEPHPDQSKKPVKGSPS